MKLRDPCSVLFSLLIFSSSFAAGAGEGASRRMLSMDSIGTIEEISQRNGLPRLFRLPFSRKKGDDIEEISEEDEAKAEEARREQEQQMESAIFQQLKKELPFASPESLSTTVQDPVIDSPVPTATASVLPSPSSSDPSPLKSTTDISPSVIPESFSIAPLPEAQEAPETKKPDAMPSEQLYIETPVPEPTDSAEEESPEPTESVPESPESAEPVESPEESAEPVESPASLESIESVESWPAFEVEEADEKRVPIVESLGSGHEDAAITAPISVVAPLAASSQMPSRKEESLETLSTPPETHQKVEEADSEVVTPKDNKHRHHIGRTMRIISWTLASICISLVVIGNFLGVYFSYIRPRLYRRTEYTAL